MLESPAWRVLSRGARQFLDRLEIEHMSHGGRENGKLPLTYADLVAYGMHENQIAPALREVALADSYELLLEYEDKYLTEKDDRSAQSFD